MKIAACFLLLLIFASGCTTTGVNVTASEQTWANAAEDVLSIGLVQVFAKNPSFIPEAQAVANALGAITDPNAITPDAVASFLAKTKISAEDQRIITSVVVSAWTQFAKHYAQQVNASTRPDVQLFLGAVSNGIKNAASSVPKG